MSSNFKGSFLTGILDTLYGIFDNERRRAKMAESEKERMDLEDQYNDENADEAYRKQVLFQENYLTPQAQLESLARGYDSVGLNRMLMGGAQPGASASTAPASSVSGTSPVASSGGVLGSLMEAFSLKLKEKQIDNEYEVSKMNAETNNFRAKTEAFLTRANWRAQEIRNKYLEQGEQLSVESRLLENAKTVEETYNIKANARLLESKKAYQDILSKYAPSLISSDIEQRRSISFLNYARAKEVEVLAVKHAYEMSLIDSQISKIDNECSYLMSLKDLTDQQINESAKRVDKMNAEISRIGSQIGLTELDIKYYLWNHSHRTSAFGVSGEISAPWNP